MRGYEYVISEFSSIDFKLSKCMHDKEIPNRDAWEYLKKNQDLLNSSLEHDDFLTIFKLL